MYTAYPYSCLLSGHKCQQAPMAQLLAPYATSDCPSVYGPVEGSSPDWQQATFLDRGRQHTSPLSTSAGLHAGNWDTWYQSGAQGHQRPIARKVDAPQSASYAEPVVQGAHTSYYCRRALPADAPDGGFRRSLRHIPPTVHVDRPQGKKAISEPHGAPPRPQARTSVQPPPSDHIPEPNMPRLGRPQGATILRESDTELSYERCFGRKCRVGLDTYRGSGRAGDLSLSYAPPKRPEDDALFFKTLKDSPTFTRFVKSLPPTPAVGPHQRRAEQVKQAQQAERRAEQQLVAGLPQPDVSDD